MTTEEFKNELERISKEHEQLDGIEVELLRSHGEFISGFKKGDKVTVTFSNWEGLVTTATMIINSCSSNWQGEVNYEFSPLKKNGEPSNIIISPRKVIKIKLAK